MSATTSWINSYDMIELILNDWIKFIEGPGDELINKY